MKVLIVSALLFLPFVSLAGKGNHSCSEKGHGHHGGTEHIEEVANELGLEGEKKAAFHRIHRDKKAKIKAVYERIKPLKKQMKQARKNYMNLLVSGASDGNFNKAFEEVAAIRAKIQELKQEKKSAKHMALTEIKNLLNEKERRKFRDLMKKHHGDGDKKRCGHR